MKIEGVENPVGDHKAVQTAENETAEKCFAEIICF